VTLLQAPTRILVTGAGGFLGRSLVHRLRADGHHILATGRGASPFPPDDGVVWHPLDLSVPAPAWPDLEGVELVYHLAWSTIPASANREPTEDVRVNVMGSLRLFEALPADARPRIVFTSSGGTVYGVLKRVPADEDHPLNPISAYGVSKRAVEAYLDVFSHETGRSAISLRIGNLYGPGQATDKMFGAVTQFSRLVLGGTPITMFGDGSITRDYVYIDDVVEALLLAAGSDFAGCLNIGTGEGHSLNAVAQAVGSALDTTPVVTHQPLRRFDVPVSVLDCRRAEDLLRWRATTSLADGVAHTLRYLRTRDASA